MRIGEDLPLDVPIPVAEIGKRFNRSTKWARRRLIRLQFEHPEEVLCIHEGDRYFGASVMALQRHWPDFGKKIARPEDVDRMVAERTRELTKEVRAVQARVRTCEKFQQMSLAWFVRDQSGPEETTAR
jgi:hypothetical protein